MANGLGNLYTPTQSELFGVVDSYNNLGGVKGTGMDFKMFSNVNGLNPIPSQGDVGFLDKTMNFLGSDTMKGLGTLGGIGLGVFNILESRKSQKQAKKQWEAENERANEIMAINREKYNTYKADKARLNSQYAG